MRTSTLLIDLDGVLRLWPAEYSALEQLHNLPADSIAGTAFEPVLLKQAITGQLTDEEWRSEVSQRLATRYPDSRAADAVAAWSEPQGQVHQDVLRLVIKAREHCKVGLITNATSRLSHDLEGLGLSQHLDFVVNSSEVGFAKPRPEIYKRALAVAGAKPLEVLFVDDTQSNVVAAEALGMLGHHFTSVVGLRVRMQTLGLGTNAA